MDDLVRMVAARMDGPVDLVAQSMGGVIAARLAIEQPQNVRRLVLTVTSGGVDMAGLGASDWRENYRKSFPRAVAWITEPRAAPSAAGREDRGADAAAVGRRRSDQPGRRRPPSRSRASRMPICTSSPAAITIWRERMRPKWRR